MLYIKGLKFRGFKSFRRAEASFPTGYVCLAGPNGSGKSNVADGIRFALGEGSLKALRAKRVSELINTSCKFAEVTLFIDGERQYEIRRAINSEGKTLYRINGKRSTRTLVMEELRQYGLQAGSHNIIAQGQVQKIVEMSAKERRQIIDSVAGISEFDEKKEEAIRELQKVEAKITEASIVLGERAVQLTELEKQKNDALSYLSAQENYRRAMASIVTSEHSRLNKTFTVTVQSQSELKSALSEVEKQSSVLQGRITELEGLKQQITQKIGSSSSREAAMHEIEELKVQIGSDTATLQERKKELQRLDSSTKGEHAALESLRKKQKENSSALNLISESIKALSKKISELEAKSGVASEGGQSELQKKLEFISEKIVSLKEQKASAESSLSAAKKMLDMKRQEKENLSSAVGTESGSKLTGEKSVLEKEVSSLQAAIERLFEREREINRALPDLDRRLLSLKEKAATLRASLSPAATSLAVKAVEEMRDSGMKGILGTVSSMVTCDPKYSTAVEAAAGQRLNYMVVDHMDTAIKAIDRLKSQRSGRCTFIPLDMSRAPSGKKQEKAAGLLGALIEFVEFEPIYSPAMEYVFSGTLLFDSAQNAKKFGLGRHRMVTLEGELIEKSGIITGGSLRGSLLSKSSLDKVETAAKSVENERKELYTQLYSLRDEMSVKRREKAESEVKLKGIEIEMRTSEERRASNKKAHEALSEIDREIVSLSKQASEFESALSKFADEIASSIGNHESIKKQLAQSTDAAKIADEKSGKELRALASQHSALQAQLEAKKEELTRIAGEISEKEGGAKEIKSQIEACKKETISLDSQIKSNSLLQKEKEGKLSELSAAAQKLMAKMSELDSQVKEIGGQFGRVKAEADKRNREFSELEVKRQITEQRLIDMKAQLEQYQGVPTIDATKAELEELANSNRTTMDSLGTTVNLSAPELYEQRKRDIDEIKARVESLDTEKKAVFSMMDEIEARKRTIFISTFSAVNDNFKKLFSYVFKGEGTLLLEQPSSPFESGLLVKIRDENHDKYLDSMSGGEKSLLALIFIFAIQMHKAAPFYILDEADAALDKENSRKLAELIRQLSEKTQFLVVTHNDTVLSAADVALGVTRTDDGSKIVGVQLTSIAAVARQKKA